MEHALIDVPVLWVIEGPSESEERHRMDTMLKRGGAMRQPWYVTFTDLILHGSRATVFDRDGRRSRLPTDEG